MITPLFPDVERRTHQGRYKVQLEIPPESTLTSGEIDTILTMASWEVKPTEKATELEGSRAVLIARERSIERYRTKLRGLQISGIGHVPLNVSSDGLYHAGGIAEFRPPSDENLMPKLPEGAMGTTYGHEGKLVSSLPSYRALGTYTSPELEEKVRKTRAISQRKFHKVGVPHIEAYGRYVCEELANGEGHFGFVVYPVPDPYAPRAGNNFIELSRRDQSSPSNEATFFFRAKTMLQKMMAALREVHDAGETHLQTHLSNWYDLKVPFLMDWGTARSLAGMSSLDRAINRALDFERPLRDINRVFNFLYPAQPETAATFLPMLLEAAVRAYHDAPVQIAEEPQIVEELDPFIWLMQAIETTHR